MENVQKISVISRFSQYDQLGPRVLPNIFPNLYYLSTLNILPASFQLLKVTHLCLSVTFEPLLYESISKFPLKSLILKAMGSIYQNCVDRNKIEKFFLFQTEITEDNIREFETFSNLSVFHLHRCSGISEKQAKRLRKILSYVKDFCVQIELPEEIIIK